ncbi:MAG: SDR family oxidoreductase [Bacteroidota bacterium]
MIEKKVLITGASRGLGLAIAKRLAPHYKLILHATSESSFKTTIPNSVLLCADLSKPEEVSDFCKRLKKEHGDELYAIINNAGIILNSSILFQPESTIDRVIQVNLKAPIMICKAALKIFNLEKRGVIINLSSIVGETGNAFQAVYAATKAGIVSFSKSLAQEVGVLHEAHNIRVLCVSPGFIETEMTDTIPQAEREKYLSRIPANKPGKPEDVANLVAFLLSEQASYINGTNLHINGGLL